MSKDEVVGPIIPVATSVSRIAHRGGQPSMAKKTYHRRRVGNRSFENHLFMFWLWCRPEKSQDDQN